MKKTLIQLLDDCKEAIVQTIVDSIPRQMPIKSPVSWMLLEYTTQYPFPPTIGIAQNFEVNKENLQNEHPLVYYNCADLEIFSEGGGYLIDFSEHEELFDQTQSELKKIEYEQAGKHVIKCYVGICKALKADKEIWKSLRLVKDFHVTARDYEDCNEEYFLRKLLPNAQLKKLNAEIAAYKKKIEDSHNQDPLISACKSFMLTESQKFEEILAEHNKSHYEDWYSTEQFYYLRPYEYEMKYHQIQSDLFLDLELEKPNVGNHYYHYQIKDNVPYAINYYSQGQLIWKIIYQRQEKVITEHQFYLTKEIPRLEFFCILHIENQLPTIYKKYSFHRYDEYRFENVKGSVSHFTEMKKIFGTGYSNLVESQFELEFKQKQLFKITSINFKNQKMVCYCSDDSFMAQAIEEYIHHLSVMAILFLKNQPLEELSKIQAVIFLSQERVPFYPSINVLKGQTLENISTYQLYENDAPLFNMGIYMSENQSSKKQAYLTQEQILQYTQLVNSKLCKEVREKIKAELNLDIKVNCKFE